MNKRTPGRFVLSETAVAGVFGIMRCSGRSLVTKVQEGKPDERLSVSAITEGLNAKLSEKERHNPKYIGKILSNIDLKVAVVGRRGSAIRNKRALKFNGGGSLRFLRSTG